MFIAGLDTVCVYDYRDSVRRDAAFDVCCNIAMSLQLVSTVESGASALCKLRTCNCW